MRRRGDQESHVLEEDFDDRKTGASLNKEVFRYVPVAVEKAEVSIFYCGHCFARFKSTESQRNDTSPMK